MGQRSWERRPLLGNAQGGPWVKCGIGHWGKCGMGKLAAAAAKIPPPLSPSTEREKVRNKSWAGEEIGSSVACSQDD